MKNKENRSKRALYFKQMNTISVISNISGLYTVYRTMENMKL